MTHNWNISTVVTMMQLCQTSDLIDGAEARPFYFGKCLNFSLRVSLLHFLRRQTGGKEPRIYKLRNDVDAMVVSSLLNDVLALLEKRRMEIFLRVKVQNFWFHVSIGADRSRQINK